MGIVHNPPITEKGWHGSETVIKVLPSDFLPNDDYDRGGIELVDAVVGNPHKMNISYYLLEIYAHVIVPQGYKATAYKVSGSSSIPRCSAYEADVEGANIIYLQGIGVFPTNLTHTLATDLVAGATNYFLLKVAPTSTNQYIYGATITIEKV